MAITLLYTHFFIIKLQLQKTYELHKGYTKTECPEEDMAASMVHTTWNQDTGVYSSKCVQKHQENVLVLLICSNIYMRQLSHRPTLTTGETE